MNKSETESATDLPPDLKLAVSIAIKRDGKFLLVLRANPPAQNMYAFPGGRVDEGESLQAAALRELEEETGLKARNPKVLTSYDLTRESEQKSAFHLTVFTADDTGGEARAQDDAKAVGWFTPDEIRKLPVPPSMIDCMDLLD